MAVRVGWAGRVGGDREGGEGGVGWGSSVMEVVLTRIYNGTWVNDWGCGSHHVGFLN